MPSVASNLVFAEQEREAGLVQITVEPGPEKLALAIFGDNGTIYEIEDPHGRAARILLLTLESTKAGVAGVPRDRVRLVDYGGCARSQSQTIRHAAMDPSPKVRLEAREILAPMFDHLPEVIMLDDAERIFVPSGNRREVAKEPYGLEIRSDNKDSSSFRLQRVEIGPNGQVKKQPIEVYSKSEMSVHMSDLLFTHPGGLRYLDPATVVSRASIAQSPHIPAAQPR